MGKVILITLLSLISCGSSNSKSSSNGIDKKIISAYDYVSQKYDGKIIVSNSFVNIDIVNFAEFISKRKNEKMSTVIDSLTKIEESKNYIEKEYPIGDLLENKNKKGKIKMFFSEPTEDYIMVEVFKVDKNLSYENLTQFRSSDVYLLFFRDDQIEEVTQITLDYN